MEMRDPIETARRVLAAYRERRRRRRGKDTFFGSLEGLLDVEDEARLSEAQRHRRRHELVAAAVADGVPWALAEWAYDIAREEGLDPALALELVRTGLGVGPPSAGLSTGAAAPASDKYVPLWLWPAPEPDALLRERMLRLSFRRLRRLVEQHGDAAAALEAFAAEPDVGFFGY